MPLRRLILCKRAQTEERPNVIPRYGWGLCLLLLSMISGCITPAHAQNEQNTAYQAVCTGSAGPGTMTIWYDRGKYSIQYLNTLQICDDARSPARWYVDLNSHTAQLDPQVVRVKLIEMIKKYGVDATARKIQVDRSLLIRFAKCYRSYVPRNLDHILMKVKPTDPNFLAAFERTRAEQRGERRCDVYHSRKLPERTLWVEPSSGYVLGERTIYESDNPRIPQLRDDFTVIRFRTVSVVPATHLQLQAGVTAILPRLFCNIALPGGVKRQVMAGDNGMLGFDLKQLLEEDERNDRTPLNAQKVKKR